MDTGQITQMTGSLIFYVARSATRWGTSITARASFRPQDFAACSCLLGATVRTMSTAAPAALAIFGQGSARLDPQPQMRVEVKRLSLTYRILVPRHY